MDANAADAHNAVSDVAQATHFAVVSFERVEPDLGQVFRALGLRSERAEHGRWIETVREMAQTLPRILRPRAIYRIDEVRRLDARRLELASSAVFDGALGQFLAHARLVATFVITIGSALERLSRHWLRAGQVMRGSIADALASEFAEATTERCRQEIRAWALRHGLDVTPAYSPGYCGMHVTQQAPLFASLPAGRINVRLTPSCLMVPIKSVSGLVGIGPAGLVKPDEYPCTYCDHPHCTQRRAPLAGTRGTCSDWAAHTGEWTPEPA